ncbi:MAG: nucleoside deaminase [Ignavibacteriaceae bacterium]
MTFSEDTYRFMYAALQEAEIGFDANEIPIGAVVVYKNKIIGRGCNQVEMLKDPTAHAEMIAITAAANFLNNWRLNECDLYVTMEPCVMCAGALISARINNLYFSVLDPKFGACGSVFNLCEEKKLSHKVNVYSGIYSEESGSLLKEFFKKLRDKKPNDNN